MKELLSASAAVALVAVACSPTAMANAPHPLSPSVNRVVGRIVVPRQESATLSIGVMTWLRSQGLTYIIPSVPAGFPPVKPLDAARAAARHTPVGPRPAIRELAIISPLTALHPLRAHAIYWAVVLTPAGSPRDRFYVTFVGVRTPTVLGSLFHPD